jgi:hypothetical protein
MPNYYRWVLTLAQELTLHTQKAEEGIIFTRFFVDMALNVAYLAELCAPVNR